MDIFKKNKTKKNKNLILKTLHFSPERLQDCARVSSAALFPLNRVVFFFKVLKEKTKEKK